MIAVIVFMCVTVSMYVYVPVLCIVSIFHMVYRFSSTIQSESVLHFYQVQLNSV